MLRWSNYKQWMPLSDSMKTIEVVNKFHDRLRKCFELKRLVKVDFIFKICFMQTLGNEKQCNCCVLQDEIFFCGQDGALLLRNSDGNASE